MLPHLGSIRTGRLTSTDSVTEVRETPRLRVDRLKENVFVNQYLIIKDLGKGAHGSVKLVFNTEDHAVYAMKVIHKKQPVHKRCNSYCTDVCAANIKSSNLRAGGSPGLVQGNSMSIDAYKAAAGSGCPVTGSDPFAGNSDAAVSTLFTAPLAGLGHQPLQQATGSTSGMSVCWDDSCAVQGSNSGIQQQQLQQPFSTSVSGTTLIAAPAVLAAGSSASHASKAAAYEAGLVPSEAVSVALGSSTVAGQNADADAVINERAVLGSGDRLGTCTITVSAADNASGAAKQKAQAAVSELASAFSSETVSGRVVLQSAIASIAGHGTTECWNTALMAALTPPTSTVAEGFNQAAGNTLNTCPSSDCVPLQPADFRDMKPNSPVLPAAGTSSLTPAASGQLILGTQPSLTTAASGSMVSAPSMGLSTSISALLGRSATPGTPEVQTGTTSVGVSAQMADLLREMAVMKKLDHPSVVSLHEVIHDPDEKLLIMVMEYMPGGPILSSLGHGITEPLPEQAVRQYLRQLLSGLDYLHSNLIVHGDLKPDNLLLSAEGKLKISDFGSAAVLPHANSLMTKSLGTPAFMAPEMCGPTSSPYKPFPAECWALGVCLYMFVYGTVPYVPASTGALYERIRSPEPVMLPAQPAVSASLAALLKGLLDKNPDTRLTLAEVCKHEWVTDSCRLTPVERCCEAGGNSSFSPVIVAVSREEKNQAITGLKQQVKEAIPAVEERTYKKGQVLVQQGKVPDGLLLILKGTCELVLLKWDPTLAVAGGDGLSGSFTGPTLTAKRDADMDFAGQLSESDSDEEDEDAEEEEDEEENASYSPLTRSLDNSFFTQHTFLGAATAKATQQLPDGKAGSFSAPSNVLAAGGGNATDDVVAPEHVLPDLLPPPRWDGKTPDSSLASARRSPFMAATPATPAAIPESGTAHVKGRTGFLSAGPVMVGEHAAGFGQRIKSAAADLFSGHRRLQAHLTDLSATEGCFEGYQQPAGTHEPACSGSSSPAHSCQSGVAAVQGSHGANTGDLRQLTPSLGASAADLRHLGASFGTPSPHASTGDLRQLIGSARSFMVGATAPPGSPGGLGVQRSASSALVGRAMQRAMRRTESMHRRMKQLVVQATMITQHNSKRQELVGIRGPGQVVGDTTLGSRALPATATVRACSKMKVLLVRRQHAAALKYQPGIKATLYKTQTESLVMDVLESFATFDSEVAAIDDLRQSLAAASASFLAGQHATAAVAAAAFVGDSSPNGGSFTAAAGGAASASSLGSIINSSFRGQNGATDEVGSIGFAAVLPGSGSVSFTAAGRNTLNPICSSAGAVLVGAAANAAGGAAEVGGHSSTSLSAIRPAGRGHSFTMASRGAAAGSLDESISPVSAGYASPRSSPSALRLGGSSRSFTAAQVGPSRASSRFALAAAAAASIPISAGSPTGPSRRALLAQQH